MQVYEATTAHPFSPPPSSISLSLSPTIRIACLEDTPRVHYHLSELNAYSQETLFLLILSQTLSFFQFPMSIDCALS